MRFVASFMGAMALAAFLATSPALAQTPWLMDYLQGWYSDPSMVNAEQPTTITLWGWFPYDCGRVTGATVIDSAHVELTLGEGPACADTVRVWHQSFALGLLPAGYHTLHIRRIFYPQGATNPEVADGSFQFYVEPNATPPPPPPPGLPDLGSVQVRCLSGWYTEPSAPTDQAPTTLVLWGWFPYYCGEVADIEPLIDWDAGSRHVALGLRRAAACTDTARTWSRAFDLGMLPQGAHTIYAAITVLDDPGDSTATRIAAIPIQVGNEPVSAVVPNPFVEETRFSVMHREAGPVRVDIYDVRGRHVANLFDGHLPAGTHPFRWGRRRADGTRVPIGIYFSRVVMDRRVITRRLVLLPR